MKNHPRLKISFRIESLFCKELSLESRLSFLLQNPRPQKGFSRVYEGSLKGSLKGF